MGKRSTKKCFAAVHAIMRLLSRRFDSRWRHICINGAIVWVDTVTKVIYEQCNVVVAALLLRYVPR